MQGWTLICIAGNIAADWWRWAGHVARCQYRPVSQKGLVAVVKIPAMSSKAEAQWFNRSGKNMKKPGMERFSQKFANTLPKFISLNLGIDHQVTSCQSSTRWDLPAVTEMDRWIPILSWLRSPLWSSWAASTSVHHILWFFSSKFFYCFSTLDAPGHHGGMCWETLETDSTMVWWLFDVWKEICFQFGDVITCQKTMLRKSVYNFFIGAGNSMRSDFAQHVGMKGCWEVSLTLEMIEHLWTCDWVKRFNGFSLDQGRQGCFPRCCHFMRFTKDGACRLNGGTELALHLMEGQGRRCNWKP